MKTLVSYIKNAAQRFAFLLPYLKPLAALGVGIFVPFLFLDAIIAFNKGLPRGGKKPHQDTVYVKLVNGSNVILGAGDEPAKDTYSNSAVEPGREQGLSTFSPGIATGTLSAKISPARVQSPTTSQKQVRGWFLLLLPFLIAGLWLVRNVLVELNPYTENDKDPEELAALLAKFSMQIGSLGTPRKIKRFSNKARFQYYILRGKGAVSNANAPRFMQLLLYIEKNDLISLIPQVKEDEAYKQFVGSLRGLLISSEDDNLVRELYVLNRGNLI